MKDLHWVFIFAAILITPFLPSILKDKCPGCTKRKLESISTLKVLNEDEPNGISYITFYKCGNCKDVYKRNRSKPMEKSSGEEYRLLSEASIANHNNI